MGLKNRLAGPSTVMVVLCAAAALCGIIFCVAGTANAVCTWTNDDTGLCAHFVIPSVITQPHKVPVKPPPVAPPAMQKPTMQEPAMKKQAATKATPKSTYKTHKMDFPSP